MVKLWRLMIEVSVKPDDIPNSNTLGFINVVTWADAVDTAKRKVAKYLESFEWSVLEFEDTHIVDRNLTYGDEMADMIDHASSNPEAIILGTFHSYEVN